MNTHKASILFVLLINLLFLATAPVAFAATIQGTQVKVCNTPNLTIPDNDTNGVNNDLTISDNGELNDIDVIVSATHPEVNNLVFTLTHGTTTITLMDQPGYPANSRGCIGKDLQSVILDDAAGSAVENACTANQPAYPGASSYKPDNLLSAFVGPGKDVNGTWTLNVSDVTNAYNSVSGTLTEWCLKYERKTDASIGPLPTPPITFAGSPAEVGTTLLTPNTFTITDGATGNDRLWIYSVTLANFSPAGTSGNFQITQPATPPIATDPNSWIKMASGQVYTFAAKCTPTTEGVRTADFIVTTNLNPPLDKITYPLQCEGQSSKYDGSAITNPVDFSFSDVGTDTAIQTVTIKNSASAVDLKINSASITGTNAGDFSIVTTGFPKTIGPGLTDTISLKCTPQAHGIRSAKLKLTTNDPANAIVYHNLRCEGKGLTYIPAPSSVLNFGATTVNTPVSKTISITNNSAAQSSWTISDSKSGAGAVMFSLVFSVNPIPAGQSGNVTVTCNPTQEGTYTATLTLTPPAPNPPVSYTLKCSAATNLTTDAVYDSDPLLPGDTFDTGSSLVGTPHTSTFTVSEIGTVANLQITNFSINNDFQLVSPSIPTTVAKGTTQTVTVKCTPSDKGNRTGTLQFNTNATNYPTASYPLTCKGLLPGYGSAPSPASTLTFSDTKIGVTTTQTLTVTQTGDADLHVTFTGISGTNAGDFKVSTPSPFPFTLAGSGGSKTITLECSPTGLGDRLAKLELTSDDPANLNPTYDLQCKGLQGVGPFYDSTPIAPSGTMDLGTTFVGVAKTGTFNAMEVGSQNLEVRIPASPITGTHASDFALVSPTSNFVISDGGAARTVTVQCNPTAVGLRQATLTLVAIEGGSLTSNNKTYTLKCTGDPTPKYTSTPMAPSGTIDFGTTNWVGVTVQKTLTMKELGTADLTVTSPTITGTDASNFQVDTTVFPATVATTAGHTNTQPVTISCKPSSAVTTHTAQLNLTTNDPLLTTVTYTLNCGGKPTPSYTSIPVINDMIDCGGGKVGVAYTNHKITVLGTTGTADVQVTGYSFLSNPSGDFAIDLTTTSFPVTGAVTNATGSPIALKITPSVALVQHTAQLQLDTNDPLLQHVTYNLTCTGGATPYYKSNLSDGTPLLPGSTIDFGNGWVGKPMTKTIDIENDATATDDLNVSLDHPVLTGVTGEVEDFALLSPLANPDFSLPDVTIPNGSGKKETVMVQCTPSNPDATVIHTATLHLISNDPVIGPPSRQKPTYTLKCAGQPTPKYESPVAPGNQIDFGVAPYNQPVTQELQISENGSSDLTMTAATITGTDAAVFTLLSPTFPFTLKTGQTPKQQQIIKVQCQQTSPLKVHTATLTMTTNDPLQPTVTYPLRCTGQPTPGYNSSPVAAGGTIDFGSTPTGLAVTKNFDIQERGSADLTVNTATPITGPNAQDFSLVSPTFPVTLPTGSGTRKNVVIQCKPTQAGSLTATLNLTSNDPVNPAPTYPLTCMGVSLDMLTSPRTLFVSVDGTGQGQVKATPEGITGCENTVKPQCRHIYQTDVEVTLTPVAEEGYEFSSWGGHEDCQDGKVKMTDNNNKMCIAFFRLVSHTLAVTTVGNGKVNSLPTGIQCGNGTTPCSAKYDKGTTVTLTASPDTGWQLTGWQGDCDTAGKVTLNQDKQCQAVFAKLPDTKPTTPTTTPSTLPVPGPSVPTQVRLILQKTGTGKGTLHTQAGELSCTDALESKSSDLGTSNCGQLFDQNTAVTLTATPDTGSSFGQWTGDCSGTTTTIVITMDKVKTCRAQFDLLPPAPPAHHVLTVNKTGLGNGTVSNAPVQCGGQCHTGATPAQQAMLNQTIQCGNNGGKCQAAYPHQTAITLTATAAADSKFTGWRKDCTGTTNSLTVILDRDKSCEANFEPTEVVTPSDNIPQILTVSKGGDCHGTIVSQPDGITLDSQSSDLASFAYPPNTTVNLTATPDQDCQFVGFSGDESCTTGRVTLQNQPVTCVATFEKQVTAAPPVKPLLPPEKAPPLVCPLTGEVSIYCNYEGQHAKDLTVTNTGNISTVVLEGTLHNQGWIANATLMPNSTLTGGVLTGYIDNQGLISDFEFRGETLTGGTLAGIITIDNPKGGILKDVKLAANTTISGGRLQGHIEGDAEAPALLQKLKVMPGSTLAHLMIGEEVELADDVTLGPGVTFLNQPTKPAVPGTVKPSDKPTTTPTGPVVKPTDKPTTPTVPGEVKPTTPTVVKPTVPATINEPLDANGQVMKDVTVGPQGKLSNVVLDGTILNRGVIKDAILQPGCHITGGILTGTIINNGCILTDVEFRGIQLTGGTLDGNIKVKPGAILQDVKLAGKAHLSGGTLKGQIQGDAKYRPILEGVTMQEDCQISEVVIAQDLDNNQCTLTNIEFQGNLLKGGTLAGIIHNRQGVLQDVSLAANTILKGGKLTGNVRGDTKGPAILEDVTVTKGSYVEHVVVGIKVKNQGTLANIEFRGDSLKGGVLAGNITNTGDGLIDDVKLGDNAHLSGGKLGGTINGNPKAPATLENVKIQAFTSLNNVILGPQVKGLDFEHVVVGPQVTIQKPDRTDTKINYTDTDGQTSTDLTVGEKTHLSNAVLQGTTVNRGRISNSTVLPDSTVTGGILGGDIVNQGTIADVEFQGITLTGGTVSGLITNTQGGILKDVKFAPQTNLTGGKLQGHIVGDADSPARLENLTILEGSEVDNVEIGDHVEVAADVKFGPGVKFTQQPVSHVPALTTTISDTQDAKGQRFNNLTVEPQGLLTRGELAGTTLNRGTVSNSFIPLDSILTGGILTGQIMNQGTLNDIEFQGTQLTGGLLGGQIRVTRQGILYNVKLLAKTHLVGGFLKGRIEGDTVNPPLLEGVTVQHDGYVNNVILGDDVENNGTLANFEFRGNLLQGGMLAGKITVTGKGAFRNVSLAPNTKLQSVRLKGKIKGDANAPALLDSLTIEDDGEVENVIINQNVTNAGTIANAEFRGTNMQGGRLAGTVRNTQAGTFKDIRLAPNASLIGGNIEGQIFGESADEPALLEDVRVASGSFLENVMIGQNVTFPKEVKFGVHVRFLKMLVGRYYYWDGRGQWLKDMTLGEDDYLWNVVLQGTLWNKGHLHNVKLQKASTLRGGILSGEIYNEGILLDFEFQGTLLIGGTLGGWIQVTRAGLLKEINLAANAHLKGGKLQGRIMGEAQAPALLEWVVILSDSFIDNVVIGENVEMEDNVTFGPGVKFARQPQLRSTTTTINEVRDGQGQTWKDVTIGPQGKLVNAKLEGTILNQGTLEDVTVQPNCTITGGILTGTIVNQGTLSDFEFQGTQLTGGRLAGQIKNTKAGIIQDVKFARQARLSGGKLKGRIEGEAQYRAWIESVTILEYSYVTYVIVGDNVANQGIIENLEFRGNLLKGGTLAGTILATWGGIFQDVSFAANATLKGGRLRGHITGDANAPALLAELLIEVDSQVKNVIIGEKVINQGTLTDIEFRGSLMIGGTYSGIIKNTQNGTFRDIQLAANARLEGGNLEAVTAGEPGAVALLEDVNVVRGSTLEYVKIGNTTVINPPVKMDTGVEFANQVLGLNTLADNIQTVEEDKGLAVDTQGRSSMTETRFTYTIETTAGQQPNQAKITVKEAKQVKLSSTLALDPQHVGKAAKLRLIASYQPVGAPAINLMRAGDQWVTWDFDETKLQSALSYAQLPSTLTVPIFEGDLSTLLGEFVIFVEYKLSDGMVVNNTKSQLTFSVVPDRSCPVYTLSDIDDINSFVSTFDLSSPKGSLKPIANQPGGQDIEGLAVHPTNSDWFYGTAGDKADVGGEKLTGYFYLIDRKAGEVTAAGPTGFDHIMTIAVNPVDKTLWGWGKQTRNPDGRWNGLIMIDQETHQAIPIKQFDYHKYDMSGLTWSRDGKKLYASSILANDTTIWVYDRETQEISPICTGFAKGRIIGIDLEPKSGRLLVGVANQHNITMMLLEPQTCVVVKQQSYADLRDKDLESIVWHPEECNDAKWIGGEVGK